MKQIKDLIDLISLEKVGENIFQGKNFQTPWGRVFGGQVLAQSLNAAYATVPDDRYAHSMHGYFILGGNLDIPITYEVDIIRDGKSFTTRRVVAYQDGKAIFNMAASFQKKEKGFDHQVQMPNVLSPDLLLTDFQQAEKHKDELAEKYAITPAKTGTMLWKITETAFENGQFNAAVSAIKELNQIAGLSINRSQNVNINSNLENMTKEQIKERLGKLLGAETSDYSMKDK